MQISMNMLVYGFWILCGLAAIFLLPPTIKRAWQDPAEAMKEWRATKVGAQLLGLVGFFLLVLSFEQTVRTYIVQQNDEYVFQTFLEAKFAVTRETAKACSHKFESLEASNNCFDYENLDGIVSFITLRNGHYFPVIQNWPRNPKIEDLR